MYLSGSVFGGLTETKTIKWGESRSMGEMGNDALVCLMMY